MGTNYYFLKAISRHEEHPKFKERIHIGKRSAAGSYCWDCDATLCPGGMNHVHSARYKNWFDACPICGLEPVEETLTESTAGRELGFNDSKPGRKKGVASCSSFTWALSKEDFERNSHLKIIDEYDREIWNFYEILLECPIQFFDLIGKEFS